MALQTTVISLSQGSPSEPSLPHCQMLGAVPRGLVHSHLLTVRGHVSGEMVALPEILMANGACDSLLPQLLRM